MAPASDLDLATGLAHDLHSLLGRLRRRLREQVNPGELTPSQISVLSRLERDGEATITSLARAEGVRPQSMGATIGALQSAGMVEGRPDPDDGRQTILRITAEGQALIRTSRAARQDWLARAIAERLSPDEQEELARGLRHLARLADA